MKRELKATVDSSVDAYLRASAPGPMALVQRLVNRGADDGRDEPNEVSKIFFNAWFAQQRTFFLFRKNLRVTNIQFAELLALMRTHVHTDMEKEKYDIHRLQFLSYEDFLPLFSGLLSDLTQVDAGKSPSGEQLNAVVEHLVPLLARTIALERFHGSCIAFLPNFMWFDLERICGEAGYVHSCGHVIYVRNVQKTSKAALVERLGSYLDGLPPASGPFVPLRLNVYNHDDDVGDDAEDRSIQASRMRHGLDSVKLHLDKFHVGDVPLTNLLPELEEEFRGRLVLTGPAGRHGSDVVVRRSHSLWLINEKSIGAANSGFNREPRWLICYDQWWRNRSPLHIFDENKPAWTSSVTIPHALLGAMVNITRPWRRDNEIVEIADPFGGTGSTVLECLKFSSEHVSCEASDNDPMCSMLAEDNAAVIGADVETLDRWLSLLDRIESEPHGTRDVPREARGMVQSATAETREFVDAAYELTERLELGAEMVVPAKVYDELGRRSLEDRLIFYLVLKTRSRHLASLARGTQAWQDAFRDETGAMRKQLRGLRALHESLMHAILTREHLRRFNDEWSLASTFAVETARLDGRTHTRDVLELPERKYDVIIADPPYGYNTDIAPLALASLYRNAFDRMLKALKAEGQLVLALPDQSFVGRRTPTFTHKEVCIRLLLALAEDQGRQVFSVADAFPSSRRALTPPYYWESDRALRRAILHFRIRDRPGSASSGDAVA